MENGSKALLMAAGVLIAVILISLLVRTYTNIGTFQRQKLTEQELQEIEAYNKQYANYENQYVYGTEVITIINRMLNDQSNKMSVEIAYKGYYTFTEEWWNEKTRKTTTKVITVKPGNSQTYTNYGTGKTLAKFYTGSVTGRNRGTEEISSDTITTRAFKCTKIGYDNSTGRINYIKFEERQFTS